MLTLMRDAAAATPDVERSRKNLERLFHDHPTFVEEHAQWLERIAGLFAYSQFLADYSIQNPFRLTQALGRLDLPVRKQEILSQAAAFYAAFADTEKSLPFRNHAMKLLRDLKKSCLLLITLRDISGATSLRECMSELNTLAEALVEFALEMSHTLMRRKFGLPTDNAFSVIGMGKLGGGELNYSSDIDLVTVYHRNEGTSTGILNPFGIRYNKISAHEYFCTLTETLSGMMQALTEDGICYRVDLRLRPNGQKGAISLDLASYHAYYEAWGKTWERLALIRANPVAGDRGLGTMFMKTVEPFVWKKSFDFNDIDEIKELKKKIDTLSDVNDVKRGYGGIREIEFFAHTFQLLYGHAKMNLRNGFLVSVLAALGKEGFLLPEEVKTLSESYLILRRIEHILQMRDDLQTYSLPADQHELNILAKKLHFENGEDFTARLKIARLKVRDMYNTLLGGTETTREILLSVIDELPDTAVLDYLQFRGFTSPPSALNNLRLLREQIATGKTLRERALLRKAIPAILEKIMGSAGKDRALGLLVSFISRIGHHESYLDLLTRREDTREIIADVFSRSTYLSRLFLNADNFEGIFEYPGIRKDPELLRETLNATLARAADPLTLVRDFKAAEELKYGLLFVKGLFDCYDFTHRLSMIADMLIRAILTYLGAGEGFAVIGLGGYGARDLNIGSDLDLLFVSSVEHGKTTRGRPLALQSIAEELIRFLSGYTEKGFAYRIDTRLRPDGSHGILAHDIEGYETYYLSAAQPWEIQSLLRARPIAGDANLLRAFMSLRKHAILRRGHEMAGSLIEDMRKRIISEVSKESSGYDIKNGPGGIKEVEFLAQYLQLKHAAVRPELIVHNTINAFQRLAKYAILDRKTEDFLVQSHHFLKALDTLLRLNEEEVVKADSALLPILSEFLQMKSTDLLLKKIRETRQKVYRVAHAWYKRNRE